MSTLPVEYFEFKSVWEYVKIEDRIVNLLLERLRLIEMRLPSKYDEATALVCNKPKDTGVIASHSIKRIYV